MYLPNPIKAAKFDQIAKLVEGLDDNNVLDTLDQIKSICDTDKQNLTSFDFITDEFCRKPMEETSTYYEYTDYNGHPHGFFFPDKCLELDMSEIKMKKSYKLTKSAALLVLILKLIKHGYYRKGMYIPTTDFLKSRLGLTNTTCHMVEWGLQSVGIINWEGTSGSYVIEDDENEWHFSGKTLKTLFVARIDVGNILRDYCSRYQYFKPNKSDFEKL